MRSFAQQRKRETIVWIFVGCLARVVLVVDWVVEEKGRGFDFDSTRLDYAMVD